jgi:RecA-family ATPase
MSCSDHTAATGIASFDVQTSCLYISLPLRIGIDFVFSRVHANNTTTKERSYRMTTQLGKCLEQATKGAAVYAEQSYETQPSADDSERVIFTAAELMQKQFRPQRWAVPGLLAQGCVLLAGRPKVGKSWFAYQLALAVASGQPAFGQVPVLQGPVLYLALEDRQERLQSRLKTLLKDGPVPESLFLSVKWSRLDSRGLDDLEFWLKHHPGARLVIIDTYQRIRPKHLRNADTYENDYRSLAPVVDLAHRRGVCILIVHHTRKTSAQDEFNTVSGSTGLTGVVDATMVLDRTRYRSESSLYITGRDIEESETFLMFDSEAMQWRWGAERSEMVWYPTREQIIKVITEAGVPMKPKQIAMKLCKGEMNVRQTLGRMERNKQIKLLERGLYTVMEDLSAPKS